MRRRDVLIRLPLAEGEAAAFEGRNAMIVPLSDGEVPQLCDAVNGVGAFLAAAARILPALADQAASEGGGGGRVAVTLAGLAEAGRAALALHGETRALLGRAKFVGGEDEEGTIQ